MLCNVLGRHSIITVAILFHNKYIDIDFDQTSFQQPYNNFIIGCGIYIIIVNHI